MKIFIDASLIIYLNVKLSDDESRVIENFWLDLVQNNSLYTNVLVLDEAIYISRKKYGVSYRDTIELIDKAIIPYTVVLPIGMDEYVGARELMLRHRLKPSDAIHAATIINNGLQAIATEDTDFDRIGIKRIWPKLL